MMAILNKVFLLLGSNIEPRIKYLEEAEKLIIENIGVVNCSSNNYESKALGFDSETSFINKVLEVTSEYSETDVLKISLDIERKLGRKRIATGYSSRTIDIDILYYNDLVLDNDNLTIPHARLHERKFTLMPLAEIAPDFKHPLFNSTNKELLHLCMDNSIVNIYL